MGGEGLGSMGLASRVWGVAGFSFRFSIAKLKVYPRHDLRFKVLGLRVVRGVSKIWPMLPQQGFE